MMLPLWVAIVALLAIAALFILWPMRRKATGSRAEQVRRRYLEANIALFNEHLAELQASLEAGRLSREAFEQLKLEQERALLEEERELAASKPTRGKNLPGGRILIATGLAMLVGSVSLYQWRGAEADVELAVLQERKARLDREDRRNERRPDPARTWAIAEKLQERLEQEPDSTQHLFMMAMYSRELGSYERAIDAYERILELEPDSPRIKADLAETLFIRDDNRVSSRGRKLLERALSLDPEEATALGLLGIDAFSKQNYQDAIDYWQRALTTMDPQSGDAMAFQRGIERARSALGKTDTVDSELQGAEVAVKVSLADDVDYDPEQWVFVYARAWEGSPMPLAITRIQAEQLPMSIVLDNTMAMSSAASLAQVEQVELVARLSRDGDAMPKVGDWQGVKGPVVVDGSEPIELQIDQAVEVLSEDEPVVD